MGCSSSVPSSKQQPVADSILHPATAKEAWQSAVAEPQLDSVTKGQKSDVTAAVADSNDKPVALTAKSASDVGNRPSASHFIDAGRSSGAWRQAALNDTASTLRSSMSPRSTEDGAASADGSIDSVDEQDLVEVEDDSGGGLMASLHKGRSDMGSLKESPLNRGTSARKVKTNRLLQTDDTEDSQASIFLDSARGPSMPEHLNSSRSGAGHKSMGTVRDCPLAVELVKVGLDSLVAVLVEGLGLWTPFEVLNLEPETGVVDRKLSEEEEDAVTQAQAAFAGRDVAENQRILAPFELDETLMEVLTCRGMEALEPELGRLCRGSVEGLAKLQVWIPDLPRSSIAAQPWFHLPIALLLLSAST